MMPPKKVYLDLTYRCNLLCKHCITKSSPYTDTSHELRIGKILSIVTELSECGVTEIQIGGGEPLLHESWSEVFSRIVACGMDLIISTNGTLMNSRIASVLADIHPKEVRVSFEGGPCVNDYIRGRSVYGRALEGLKRLITSGTRTSVRVTVHGIIDYQIHCLFNDLAKAGVKSVKASKIKPFGRACNFETPSDYAIAKNVSMLKESANIHDIKLCLSADDPELGEGSAQDTKPRGSLCKTCGAGFGTCYISPKGVVLPCSALPAEPFGDLRVSSFSEIWNGARASQFRALCEGREMRRICDAHIMYNNSQERSVLWRNGHCSQVNLF